MGVSSVINRVVDNGDGVTTTFAYPFYFFGTGDLKVYLYDTILGGAVLQTLGTNYTITGTPNAQGLYTTGGNVVFTTAPIATSIVVIYRDGLRTQNYALQQNGSISSSSLVQQMDYLTLLIQRLEDQVARCIQIPDGVGATFNPILPTNIALNPSQFIQVNQAANGLALNSTLSPFNQLTIPYTQLQTSGTTTSFTLFTIPQGCILTYLVVKHSQSFTGTPITDVTSSYGITGTPSLFMPSFDLFQAVGPSTYDSVVANYIGSFASSTNVIITATSTGGNLSALTQGSLSVWYNYDTL